MACPPCKRKNKSVCLYKLTLHYQPCSLNCYHQIPQYPVPLFLYRHLIKTLLEVYSFALYQDLVHPLLTVYFQQRNSSFAWKEEAGAVFLGDIYMELDAKSG